MAFPVAYTLYMSVHSWFASSLTSPQFIGLGNFRRAFVEDDRFRNALWLTVYFTGLATLLQLMLGVAIALVLNRPFRGKGLVRSIFLLPMVATPVAIALVGMMMYNPTLGVMNYLVGLVGLGPYKWVSNAAVVVPALVIVDTWEWTPLITLITLAGLATLPIEPYESALIDGASSAQMFWRITLPLLRPTIIVALLFRAIDCLKTFDIIYVMTQGGPGFASETLNVYTFQVGLFYFHIGYASSLLVILFALVLGVSLLLIKVRRGAWGGGRGIASPRARERLGVRPGRRAALALPLPAGLDAPLVGQDSGSEHGVSARADLHADARQLSRGLPEEPVLHVHLEQPGGGRRVHGPGAAARPSRRLRHRAVQAHGDRSLHPDGADGARDRLSHPVVHPVHQGEADRHLYRAHPHPPDRGAAARAVGDDRVLRGRARRADRGGADRRLLALGRVPAHRHPARQARHRGDRHPRLHLLVEQFPLLADRRRLQDPHAPDRRLQLPL